MRGRFAVKKKEHQFEKLRREIGEKSGAVIENLLRYNSLLKGLQQELDGSKSVDPLFISITLQNIEKKIEDSIHQVIDGSLKAMDIISALEKEVVDRKLLQQETDIIRSIVLSRENVVNWKSYTQELLKKLKRVYPFDLFFLFFEEGKKFRLYMFFNSKMGEGLLKLVKNSIKEKLGLSGDIPVEEEVFFISQSKKSSNSSPKITVHMHSFLEDSPVIGGVLGIATVSERELQKKEENIINSLLSIMALVTGSSIALSRAISELEYYAGHDPLTGLYNRRIFEDLLRYEISRASRKGYHFSLILIDLDNFKYINDTYGHNTGDIVLKSVADILESSIRDGDLVARIGGDEFVIMLSETRLEEGVKVAERVRKNLSENRVCLLDGSFISVSASFGVVEYPTHGKTKEELLIVVDNALYRAKELGKNKVYIPTTAEIEKTIKEKRKEFSLLQEAIEEDLFVPFFQPIYSLKEKSIYAYEVLARLKAEDGKFISAYSFISLAEKLGKIREIDLMIIRKALRQKKEENINKKLFINLSAAAISDVEFWKEVFSIVESCGISPEEVVFEITEREAVKDITEVQNLILKLKEKGFCFAIDDFGSGYSSFYYMKYFPVDYVKIDGEFVKELGVKEKNSTAFVESMNFLCKKLGIKTVAEFVENEEIYRVLKEINVDFGQGFFLGKPQPFFSLK